MFAIQVTLQAAAFVALSVLVFILHGLLVSMLITTCSNAYAFAARLNAKSVQETVHK